MKPSSSAAETKISNRARLLGSPCRIVNVLGAVLCQSPLTGRPLLALNSCTTGGGGGAAVIVDYEKGEEQVLRLYPGNGGWSVAGLGRGRILFESLDPLGLFVVDLNKTPIEIERVASHDVNTYAWQFAVGADGAVTMGSYSPCHVYRYRPGTSQIEDLGHVGPEANLYVRSVGVTGDGWVLAYVMTEEPGIVVFRPEREERMFIATTGSWVFFVTVGDTVYATIDGRLQQFDSATQTFVANSLLASPSGEPWTGLLPNSTPEKLLATTVDNAIWLLQPGQEPRCIWTLDLRGGSIVGIDAANRVVGVRGQDYFVAEPLAGDIVPVPIASDVPAVAIHFLRADPAGGVTGGPSFGQTLFRFDAARGLDQNTPQVVDEGGEVYDGRWIDGKFYFVAYHRGEFGCWDPGQPWDQWNGANPRLLAEFVEHPIGPLCRPMAGLAVGPGGRLYSGGSAPYGIAGGALVEFDIVSGQSRAWPDSVFAAEMSIGHIDADEKYVYGVTCNAFNGIDRPHKPVVYWVFDPATERVVYNEELQGAGERPALVCVPETGRAWLATAVGLRRFDPASLRFDLELGWPAGIDVPWNLTRRDVRGNRVWFATGRHIVRLDDGDVPRIAIVAECDGAAQNVAAGYDGWLYYSSCMDLWAMPLDLEGDGGR